MEKGEPPCGIILTVSAGMIGKNGYRHWLANFLDTMNRNAEGEDWYYYMRTSGKPKQDKHIQYVYLCIGGKIRYRAIYAGARDGGEMQFENHDAPISAKAWVLLAGPIEKAPYPIKRQGFQGFRYTEKLF